MNKVMKIFGAFLAVATLVVIALVIMAKILITPERVKETVLPMIEKNLHRKIELGDVSVSLLSGIQLKSLKIYELNQTEVFVSSDLVRLKYQLLPLLSMRVVIDEVLVDQPNMRIVRLADGQYNFSDLIAGEKLAKETATAEKRAVSEKPGSSIDLLVSQVRIQNGELLFLDHVLNDSAPYRYDIKDLDLTADGITLTGAVPVKIQCGLNGSQFKLDGRINILQRSGEFDISLEGVDILTFRPYFDGKIPGQIDRMKLDLNSRVSASENNVAADGEIVLSDVDMVLNAMPDVPIQQARLSVSHELDVNLSSGQLNLPRLSVDFNGLKAETSGTLVDLFGTPQADLELVIPGVDLRQAMVSIPLVLIKDVKDLDPAGVVEVQARLVGAVDDPIKMLSNATIDLENVQATAAGYRPSLNGRLKLIATQLTSEALTMRMGDNTANINLVVKDVFGKPLVTTVDLSSERFMLDPLLKGSAGAVVVADESPVNTPVKSSSANPAPRATTTPKELGPYDIPVHASGMIRIGETLYKGLSIRDFVATYQLQNNVLTLEQMNGSMAGGKFSNRAQINLGRKGLEYNADVDLRTIQADPLLTAFIPEAAGTILGAMNLNMKISGRGTQWETLSKKLNGKGNMLVTDGRLVSPGLVKGFSSFLQMPEMDELPFENFEGAFDIDNGRIKFDSRMSNSQIKLSPKGTIGLDGSLDVSLDTRLSPEVSNRLDQKGQVTQYLKDKEGWSQLPLMVSGNFAKPRFGLDPAAIKEQATKALSRELEGQIDKFLKKNVPSKEQQEQQPNEGSQIEDPAQKVLKDSLKKLFGN